MAKAERQPDQIAEQRCERDLAEARQQRHRTERADQLDIKLDADEEQQYRDTKFRQQVDLRVRPHNVECGRAGDQSDCNETDDEWLTEDNAQEADHGSHHQEHRNLSEWRMKDRLHQHGEPLAFRSAEAPIA